MTARRRDPEELTLEDAAERFLGRKRGSKADATVREYGYRLNRFREFCDQEGIETVGELHPLDFDDYMAAREATGVQPITLQKHFGTIREFVEFLESLGAVDDGLHQAVPDVDVPRGGAVNDEMLEPADGDALLRHYRDSSELYGTREHAILEIIWTSGCRRGAVRGLDLRDFDPEANSLAFKHRPDTGTPLKKRPDGERTIALPAAVTAALEHYTTHNRVDVRDDDGRRPLLTTNQGRPATSTIQRWCYVATIPCVRMDCPHGKQRPSCEWTTANKANHCPSSRGPTAIKSGAITRMLNRTSRDRVRHRANTEQWQNYDLASQQEKMEQRDRETVPEIELDADTEADSS